MTCPPGVMPGQQVRVPLPDPAPATAPVAAAAPPQVVVHATPAPAPPAQPAPMAATPQDLYGFLVAQRCEAYYAALQGLGAQVPLDLKDMEDADFDSIGMKLLEK